MKGKTFWLGLALVALLPRMAAAQNAVQVSTDITCTDVTQADCTIKKNAPFHVVSDPASITDTTPTEKWRLYVDGARVGEQAALPGSGMNFFFGSGMTVVGDHVLYAEAVGTGYDATGQVVEVVSGPSATVKVHIVTGSLSAPKNLRISKQ